VRTYGFRKDAIQLRQSTIIVRHVSTSFAVTKSSDEERENPATVGDEEAEDEISKEDDDSNGSDYEYNFWGCMNAFYIGLILWFFYIVFAIYTRKRDKAENALPILGRVSEGNGGKVNHEGYEEADPNMWRVR
jgi:hypothetical protein